MISRRDNEHFLDDSAVASWIGTSTRTLQRHLKAGFISPPVRSQGRHRLWTVQEAEIAKSDAGQIRESIARRRKALSGRQLTLQL